ncbi:carbohydrate ABC transporter permease [Arthrobacter sp. NPDC056493]|uniref:carbohydrate ABC transporter permease n=1 Tax=Arthrobacter sp. NPDC056493 TaxID=3345839 RepID=UPI00366B7DD2
MALSTTSPSVRSVQPGAVQQPRRRLRLPFSSLAFMAPIVVVFLVLFVVPMGQSLYFSFTDFNGYVSNPKFVGFANYAQLFKDPSMLSALGYTVFYAVSTTVLVTATAIPLALTLNRKFVGLNFVRSAFFFPAIPSVAVLGLVWGFILNPLGSGVLNSLIHSLTGLGPIPWLSQSTLAQLSTVAVTVWALTGWHAVLYLAYLQAIPADYYEVAKIDGASGWQSFRYITLPLLVPAMAVSQLLLMTNGLKVYDLPFTLTHGGPGFSTRTLTQSLIEDGIAQSRVGAASALAVLFLIVVGLVVLGQMAISSALQRKFS